MQGIPRFISIFDPRVTIEVGMLAFIKSNDPIWDFVAEVDDYYTVEINTVKYIMGPITDMDQLVQNDLNDETKILVIEYANGFLPLTNHGCLCVIELDQIGREVEFEVVSSESGLEMAILVE